MVKANVEAGANSLGLVGPYSVTELCQILLLEVHSVGPLFGLVRAQTTSSRGNRHTARLWIHGAQSSFWNTIHATGTGFQRHRQVCRKPRLRHRDPSLLPLQTNTWLSVRAVSEPLFGRGLVHSSESTGSLPQSAACRPRLRPKWQLHCFPCRWRPLTPRAVVFVVALGALVEL